MNKEVYLLCPQIPLNKTGIVVSMLRRAELLAKGGYQVFIFTLEHDLNTFKNFENIYQSGLLENRHNIKLVNLFSLLQKKEKKIKEVEYPKPAEGCIFDANNNRIYKDSKNKTLRYEFFRNSKIEYINFINDNGIAQRSRYDEYGQLCCIQKLENKNVISEDFFDIHGRIVLKIDYFADSVKKIQRIHLFDEHGFVRGSFEGVVHLLRYLLHTELCTDLNTIYYFIIDKPIYYSPLWYKDNPENYAFIGTFHSSHFLNHLDPNSSPNRNYDPYILHTDRWNALIILTERQKQDIENRYGEHSAHTVIPHTLSESPEITHHNVNYNKFVSLARYTQAKRLDLLVDIFKEVVKAHPKAQLDLYGFGSEIKNLKEKIIALELEENVFLKPFASNVNEILQSASMLLLTSQTESFCLVLMEALANSCPITAFDIRYGPEEMVEHNYNGYLIPEGESALYAQTIIEYLNDTARAEKMRGNALASSSKLSSTAVLAKWHELLDRIALDITDKQYSNNGRTAVI